MRDSTFAFALLLVFALTIMATFARVEDVEALAVITLRALYLEVGVDEKDVPDVQLSTKVS